MILEDIFNTLSESTRLPSNYSDRVISELELRERKRKNKKKEKIFKNVPVETVEYFELVSKIHNSLKKELKGYRNEDIRNMAKKFSEYIKVELVEANFEPQEGVNGNQRLDDNEEE